MVTMPSRNARAQAERASRLLDRLLLQYERRLAAEIRRAMLQAWRLYSTGSDTWLAVTMADHEARSRRLLEALWRSSAAVGERVAPVGKARHDVEVKADVPDTPAATEAIARYIRLYSGDKITQITQTTLDDVQRVISQGIEAGLTERELASQIRAYAVTKSLSRAQTIARTETHQASSFVTDEMVKASGIEFEREWVASKGERTRRAHRDADGQRRGMTEPFSVGGELLMYPGDPDGSAHNVINCRCQIAYLPKR